MSERILGPTGSRRRRRFLFVPMLAIATMALFFVVGAQAVHNDGLFELGPTATAPEAGITNILGNATDAGPDWADLFGADTLPIAGALATYGGLADAFIADPSSAAGATDPTTFSGFGTSNKNVDPVSTSDCTAPGNTYPSCTPWGWAGGNIPPKDDLTNVYAYETVPTAGDFANHLIVYGGIEREDPSGDSHVDLEFFQNKVSLCATAGCSTFLGNRKPNDVIISMDFLKGGALGSVTIRKWSGSDYILEGVAGGEGCFSAPAPSNEADAICAFNNGAAIDGGPWPNYDNHAKVITTLEQNAFTEVGVDLTAVLGASPCLSTFMGKTRSSGSFTSELKDFAGPKSFAPCAPSTALSVLPVSAKVESGTNSTLLTFSELNNGNEALLNPTVTANNGCTPIYSSGDANSNGKLDVAETWVFTCTVTNITANTTITAYGSGTGAFSGILVTGNPTCTNSATTLCSAAERVTVTITVIKPATFLLKKAQVAITYTYYEKNTGDDPIASPSVTDDTCTSVTAVLGTDGVHNVGDANNDGKLDPGEIWKFTCTASSTEGADYDVTNTATGHGTDSFGNAVPATNETDSVRVQVTHAAPNSFP
jgi:archaellum component FlaG (FlaF/FlaG flagellin family)